MYNMHNIVENHFIIAIAPEHDGHADIAFRRLIAEVKRRLSGIGRGTKNLLSRAPRALEGTLSRSFQLHLQTLVPTNPPVPQQRGH
jgi:hypothetical protein